MPTKTKKKPAKKPTKKPAPKRSTKQGPSGAVVDSPERQAKAAAIQPPPAEPGKMSALDAAARVLGEEGEPLTASKLVRLMSERGYWSTPTGKTPHATLNTAIVREIARKGEAARFTKHPDGGFTLSIL